MQTFLPHESFLQTMQVLNYRRLGKQRVEAKQILSAIGGTGGWANHPATTMWRNYPIALQYYMECDIAEWVRRGYHNTMPTTHMERPPEHLMPWWLGDNSFHASHRSNLLRKDPDYYGRFGWTEPHDLEYIWPAADRTSR